MSNQIETNITIDYGIRDRLSVALRIFLVVPILIFASAFSAWSSSSEASSFTSGLLVLPVILALLFRGIYPSYVLSFNKALLALTTRVGAYALLLHDTYPSIEESELVKVSFPEIEGGAKLNRYLPLVKWFLAIPLFIVGIVYTLYGLAVLLFAWISILATGKLPEKCGNVLLGLIRFWNRIYGYAIVLVTDEYPSFSLQEATV
jgi:small-conductance mechanosensitive channel